MSNITSSQYWIEVESLAASIAEDAMSQCDNNRDDAAHLALDFWSLPTEVLIAVGEALDEVEANQAENKTDL